MTRYILIDSISGHVFADSADFSGSKFRTPVTFAKAFDVATGEPGRDYEWLRSAPPHGGLGYHVYRPRPSMELPPVEDGSTEAELDAIKQSCSYVGFIRCWPAKERAKAA